MIDPRALVPRPPDWQVDFAAIDAALPAVRALRGCPQSPIHHAEGDVWTHTRMVLEALAGLDGWRRLPEPARRALFVAAIFHDTGKPATTRTDEYSRITSRGHARVGATLARRVLWEVGVPVPEREAIVAIIRRHMLPFWAVDGDDPARAVTVASLTARLDRLALHAEADARGRICRQPEQQLEQVALFVELAREHGCLEGPRPFASPHGRFLYGHRRWSQPDVAPHDGFGSRVTVLSGLPGAGKDRWIQDHLDGLPVVSLDALRRRLDIDPEDEQGAVVQAAREEAREHLRAARDFVWNATLLSRRLREATLGLCADYRAHLRLVHVEVGPERLRRQNREREHPVPAAVVETLLERWEVPEPWEAHEVEHWVDGERVEPLAID